MEREKEKPFNVVFSYHGHQCGMDIWASDKEDAEYKIKQMATTGIIRNVGFPMISSCGHRCPECDAKFNVDVRSNGVVSMVVAPARSAEPEKHL